MESRKKLTISLVILLFLSLFTNGMLVSFPLVKIAEAGNITSYNDTNTTITVTVYQAEPIIEFFDLQNSSGVTKLNQQIDVEEQYKFVVNITSDQGWADVDYINITAWFDNGSEATTYNQTKGGNLNMFLQYENTTGNANWTMLWPDDEVTFYNTSCTETIINANTHNLTFLFTPRNQTRYAPGDGAWDTADGHNDKWSWNFNITVDDSSANQGYNTSEYGIYMYSHITQVTENPSGSGEPGDTDIALQPHTNVTTQCNANYTLSTNITNLSRDGGGAWINRTNLSAKGGNLSRTNFSISDPLYIYGTALTYRPHLNDTKEDTVEITYWVNITIGQLPGDYNTTVTYTLNGET